MKDKTSGLQKRSTQDTDSIIETTKQKVVSWIIRKWEFNRVTTVIYKKYENR